MTAFATRWDCRSYIFRKWILGSLSAVSLNASGYTEDTSPLICYFVAAAGFCLLGYVGLIKSLVAWATV